MRSASSAAAGSSSPESVAPAASCARVTDWNASPARYEMSSGSVALLRRLLRVGGDDGEEAHLVVLRRELLQPEVEADARGQEVLVQVDDDERVGVRRVDDVDVLKLVDEVERAVRRQVGEGGDLLLHLLQPLRGTRGSASSSSSSLSSSSLASAAACGATFTWRALSISSRRTASAVRCSCARALCCRASAITPFGPVLRASGANAIFSGRRASRGRRRRADSDVVVLEAVDRVHDRPSILLEGGGRCWIGPRSWLRLGCA